MRLHLSLVFIVVVASACTPPVPNGKSCTSDSECADGFCTDGVCCAERCDGVCSACITERTGVASGTCAPVSAGTDPDAECADSACGTGLCGASGCGLKAAGIECRATQGVCDVAETCTGSSTTCPADAFAAASTTCRASVGVCDVAETCSGSAAACPADGFAATTVSCRASAGTCDLQEFCSGTDASCPVDAFAPPTMACRAASGVCDAPETCTGAGVDCPADAVLPSTTVCRAAAGVCDVADTCDGVSTTCGADVLAPSSQSCRAANGPCDLAEACTGSSADCPADAFRTASTTCRPSAGTCDVPESCNGLSAVCPADAFVNAGTVCRAANGACDASETCSGASATCPTDVRQPSTFVCRASTGTCDPQETCDGVSNLCPMDGFLPASSLACAPNRCTGFSGACTASCSDNTGCAPDTRSVCNQSTGQCRTAKFVFLTSGTFGANLGGLTGADALCASHAADAGLTGTYLPWLSTSGTVTPRARFSMTAQAYALVDKTVIATGFGDLVDGQIIGPINRDERGVVQTTNLGVLTGTNPSGFVYNQMAPTTGHCIGWTSTASTQSASMGAANQYSQNWTTGSLPTCNTVTAGRLYCFEQ